MSDEDFKGLVNEFALDLEESFPNPMCITGFVSLEKCAKNCYSKCIFYKMKFIKNLQEEYK